MAATSREGSRSRRPAARGRPRRVAQRPLPSITIPTCREVLCFTKLRRKKNPSLRLPGGADQRLHVIEIALERPPAGRRQLVLGLRHPARERLGALEVLRLLELARVHA